MIALKKGLRGFLYSLIALLGVLLLYFLIALTTSYITVSETSSTAPTKTIYLQTNGVHLDIVLPIDLIDTNLLSGLVHTPQDGYISFGWGDENFYLNTPTWGDLTFYNAFSALFLESSTLIHTTRYTHPQKQWVKVEVDAEQLQTVQQQIDQSFNLEQGTKSIIPEAGYSYHDEFYKAKGSYSCFKTCNTWVNDIFKKAGLKSCLWTPFDVFLIQKHQVPHRP